MSDKNPLDWLIDKLEELSMRAPILYIVVVGLLVAAFFLLSMWRIL